MKFYRYRLKNKKNRRCKIFKIWTKKAKKYFNSDSKFQSFSIS